MNCNEALGLIAAQTDGELDPLREHALKLHLSGCESCRAALMQQQALRERLRAELPRFTAPAALRENVRTSLAAASAVTTRPPTSITRPARARWLSIGALGGCCATVMAWLIAGAVLDWRAGDDLAHEAVASHVRATLGKHLVDVASSDRHTVRPWLSSRLDYSPPVQDLGDEGFPLLGARIEYFGRQPVAILVYRYREHAIDVMVRPQAARAAPDALRTLRGFNVVQTSGLGMDWRAVSDMQSDGLTRFVRRLAGEAGPARLPPE